MAGKPKTIVREVSVYHKADEFIVERADGSMTIALTAKDVTNAIKSDDLKLAKKRSAMVVTRVTWHPVFVTTNEKGK